MPSDYYFSSYFIGKRALEYPQQRGYERNTVYTVYIIYKNKYFKTIDLDTCDMRNTLDGRGVTCYGVHNSNDTSPFNLDLVVRIQPQELSFRSSTPSAPLFLAGA
jgi:hypothetical protein